MPLLLGKLGTGIGAVVLPALCGFRSRGVLANLTIKILLDREGFLYSYGVGVSGVDVGGAGVDVDEVAGPLVLVAAAPPPITTWT